MRLNRFDNKDFDRGRSHWLEALWRVCDGLLLSSWLPGSGWRHRLLRMFGARIGRGVVLKPGVRVKFPWRLVVGDHSWIGEDAWIDNLDWVRIGAHCCVSQGAYLCTGSHDWSRESFDLRTAPIELGDGCWVAAFSRLAPGVTLGAGAVVCFGAIVTGSVAADSIVAGNPAVEIGRREIRP